MEKYISFLTRSSMWKSGTRSFLPSALIWTVISMWQALTASCYPENWRPIWPGGMFLSMYIPLCCRRYRNFMRSMDSHTPGNSFLRITWNMAACRCVWCCRMNIPSAPIWRMSTILLWWKIFSPGMRSGMRACWGNFWNFFWTISEIRFPHARSADPCCQPGNRPPWTRCWIILISCRLEWFSQKRNDMILRGKTSWHPQKSIMPVTSDFVMWARPVSRSTQANCWRMWCIWKC